MEGRGYRGEEYLLHFPAHLRQIERVVSLFGVRYSYSKIRKFLVSGFREWAFLFCASNQLIKAPGGFMLLFVGGAHLLRVLYLGAT